MASRLFGIKVQETSFPHNFLVFAAGETDKIAGVVLVVVGLLYPYVKHLALERLPSDIVFKSGDLSCFFPIVTRIIARVVVTINFNLFRYRKLVYVISLPTPSHLPLAVTAKACWRF